MNICPTFTKTSPNLTFVFIERSIFTTIDDLNEDLSYLYKYLFNCSFSLKIVDSFNHYDVLRFSLGRAVLPSFVEIREQNSLGCPICFSNGNLGSVCALKVPPLRTPFIPGDQIDKRSVYCTRKH